MLYYKTFIQSPDHPWVVLVHGAGGSSSIWFRQIKAYRKHFNILIPDLRGHGRSSRLSKFWNRSYTFESLSSDILEVMDHLEIDKAHFVGISLGTIMIRTIAEMQPERVQSMTMAGAVMRLNFRSRFLVGLGNFFKHMVPYMWLYRLFAWIIMPKKRHSGSRFLFIREARKLYRDEFLRWFKLTNQVNPLLRLFREKPSRAPVLYLMGSEDYMFLPTIKKLAREHSNAFLKVIESAGHVCNIDQPGQFNRHSIRFIQSLSR